MVDPNVLVISHTSFTKENSMGSTLAAYLEQYPAENISQLYIKEMLPNIPVCYRYFKITDSELLAKIKHPFKIKVGTEISFTPSEIEAAKGSGATADARGAQRNRARGMILRDMLWSTRLWNTKRFRAWIKKVAPDIILVQPGDFAYLLKLATRLSKKLGIPLVVHQSEAYYIKPMQSNTLAYRIYRKRFNRAYEKMMARASECVYLCEALERDYKKYFPMGCTLMKGIPKKSIEPREFDAKNPRFLYAGNLGEAVGRCKPLAEVGRAVKKLGFHVDVYTATKGEHMAELTEENGIVLHCAVPHDELERQISESDFLLHIENDSHEHIVDLKYAFSTKISEMLASGRCPVIYGPTEIAGIAYFKEHGLGCVIEQKEDLCEKIKELVENSALREGYIERAKQWACKYHAAEENGKKMAELLRNATMQK